MKHLLKWLISWIQKNDPHERSCVTCKYHHVENPSHPREPILDQHHCLLFKNPEYDNVTGATFYRFPAGMGCRIARDFKSMCGPCGKRWTPKDRN